MARKKEFSMNNETRKIEPEYIRFSEAVKRGLIPSKSWYYANKPESFPKPYKRTDSKGGHLWFNLQQLREWNENKMNMFSLRD